MARRAVLSLQVEGAEMLARRLAPDHLLGRPIGTLLEEAAQLGQRQAGKRAPTLSGRLAGGIRTSVHADVAGPYATVRVQGIAHNGFRYGFALDASPRYHYRGRKAKTKGWFSKVPAIIRRLLRLQLRKAEQEIEASFEAGGSVGGGGR